LTLQNLALENIEVFMQSPLSLFTGGQTEKVGTLMIALRFTKDWAVLSANPPSSVGLGANDQNLLQRAPFHNAFIDLAFAFVRQVVTNDPELLHPTILSG
jgi:hypothetical protein